jgi:trehalose 6-phosphate phosphatase
MMRPRRGVLSLWRNWEGVAGRVRSSRRVALFLDFDGTLVPIARRPNLVSLVPETRGILRRLARRKNVTLAIISGRRRAELQRFVGVAGIHYFGLYGWERVRNVVVTASARKALARAWSKLSLHLYAYPSVWIEDKRSSLSIHLLETPPRFQEKVRREVRSVLRPFEHSLQRFENLRDIEIVPCAIPDKGVAVRKFLAQPAMRGAFPIYFGDDLSDEPAFAAVRKGVSVLVGGRHATRAQFAVRGPAEVGAALARLEGELA